MWWKQKLKFCCYRGIKNKLTLKADLPSGGVITQTFLLATDDYKIDNTVSITGNSLSKNVSLHWENYLDRIEKIPIMKNFIALSILKNLIKTDYCSCRDNDVKELPNKTVSWISHSHQFLIRH